MEKFKFSPVGIIVHCSDNDVTPRFVDGRVTYPIENIGVDDIRRWHKQRGFDDVGYHFVIDYHGNIHKGRDIEYIGAHCFGMNRNTIGICYIGGRYGECACDTRTQAQKDAIVNLIKTLRFEIPSLNWVAGHDECVHSESYTKDCPCFDARNEYSSLFNQKF